MSFDHGSSLSPLPSMTSSAIGEHDDEKLHIDGVGFIVSVQSMEEGEKERERERERERKPHL